MSKEAGEREAFTQTLTQIIVLPVEVEMKEGSQHSPIQVTVNEYQLLLICSMRHDHRQIQVVVFVKQIMVHETVHCLMGSQWMKDGN